jgi:hypothetical protein
MLSGICSRCLKYIQLIDNINIGSKQEFGTLQYLINMKNKPLSIDNTMRLALAGSGMCMFVVSAKFDLINVKDALEVLISEVSTGLVGIDSPRFRV